MRKLICVAASILMLSASGAVAGNGHHRMRYASVSGGHDYSAGGQMESASIAGGTARHRHFARHHTEYTGATSHSDWSARDNSCLNVPNLPDQFACSAN